VDHLPQASAPSGPVHLLEYSSTVLRRSTSQALAADPPALIHLDSPQPSTAAAALPPVRGSARTQVESDVAPPSRDPTTFRPLVDNIGHQAALVDGLNDGSLRLPLERHDFRTGTRTPPSTGAASETSWYRTGGHYVLHPTPSGPLCLVASSFLGPTYLFPNRDGMDYLLAAHVPAQVLGVSRRHAAAHRRGAGWLPRRY